MEYTPEFENELRDLEACSMRLVDTEDGTDDFVHAQHQFVAILDDLVNTYPLDCDELERHVNEITRIYRRDNENTALKRISTVHTAFLEEVCDDYDPQY